MAGKRGNGEGSITQLSDGRWQARLTLEGGRRVAVYGKTREEASKKLTKALSDRDDGKAVGLDQRQTVGQFLNHWLEISVRTSVRPATLASYSDLLRLHLLPELGKFTLTKLNPQHVQAMLTRKLEAGLSPRRVQYIRAVLRRALGQALKWEMVGRNVAVLTNPPRLVRHEIQPLTPEQARQFLEVIRGDRLEALYVSALSLGLRQGEVLGLRWQDIDLDAGMVRVSVALQRIDKEYRLVEPKTQRSRRVLSLPQTAIAALRSQRIRQLEERLRGGGAWGNTWDLVFTTEAGAPLHSSTVTHGFQKLLQYAGLPRVRFHDLRHTAASLLLAQGAPARMIMEVLGHSQISLTMNTYAHVMPAAMREAANHMDAMLTAK